MNAKMTRIVLLAIVALGVLSCAPAAPAPTPTPTAAPALRRPEGMTPEQVTEAFYGWYLQQVSGPVRSNPVADGSYKAVPYLDAAFVRQVEQAVASFVGGGYDPFLCAQDVPKSASVGPATVSGERATTVVSTSFPGHAFEVTLTLGGGAWRISGINCTPGRVAPAPTPEPTAASIPAGEPGGQVYRSEEYGFQVRYPAGWVYKEVRNDPGHPPLGPENIKMVVMFMPQAWADEMAKSGPPDPSAPTIAPFALEVSVGSLAAYRDAYPEPTTATPLEFEGSTAVREVEQVTDTISIIRYVYQSPHDPNLRLTFFDYISGFPDRLPGNEAVIETFETMLPGVEFVP